MTCMRTTLNLDDHLLEEVMRATGARTKTEAITLALEELVQHRKLERLKALSGKIHLDLDWRAQEDLELRHQEALKRRRDDHR